MSSSQARLINVSLRIITLASKFLLVFLLARFLEPEELGLYGLITVTVSYLLFFLGFDFYVYTTREILKLEPSLRGRLLKSQIGFSLTLYLIFIPMSTVLFFFKFLPWWVFPWFILLLVFEHIAQEINRLLIALSRQLAASCVLFLRMGAWSLIVVLLMIFDKRFRGLETVFLGWTVGVFIALLIGGYVISKLKMGGWRQRVNWKWVRTGFTIAFPMMLATLSIRGLFTLDRYWFEALVGLDVLGVYVLFSGICGALLSFMDAGVFAFIYPALVSAHANEDSATFQQKFRQLAVQTTLLVGIVSAGAWVVVSFLVKLLDRPIYLENLPLFGWLLIGNALFLISMVPHYGLYARRKDRPIIIGQLAGLMVFLMSTGAFSFFDNELAVPYGLITAFGFILSWKTLQFYRLTPANWR